MPVTLASSRSLACSCWAVFTALTLAGSKAYADDDPITQCIAANDRGLDLRKQGKLIEARRVLLSCAVAACGTDINAVCQKRLADINSSLPSIVFSAKDAAGNDVAGVSVFVDGSPDGTMIDGRPIVLNPGSHTFRFVTAGLPAVERSFVLVEGAKDRQERVNLAASSAAAPTPMTNAVSPEPEPSSSHGQQTAAFWAGGLGALALGTGAVFGVLAKLKWEASQSACETSTNCKNHEDAVSDHNAAVTDAAVSTVTCIAGAAAVGTGVILLLTAPHGSPGARGTGNAVQVSPILGPGAMALSIRGVFR